MDKDLLARRKMIQSSNGKVKEKGNRQRSAKFG
jgi:hypothetical protein